MQYCTNTSSCVLIAKYLSLPYVYKCPINPTFFLYHQIFFSLWRCILVSSTQGSPAHQSSCHDAADRYSRATLNWRPQLCTWSPGFGRERANSERPLQSQASRGTQKCMVNQFELVYSWTGQGQQSIEEPPTRLKITENYNTSSSSLILFCVFHNLFPLNCCRIMFTALT